MSDRCPVGGLDRMKDSDLRPSDLRPSDATDDSCLHTEEVQNSVGHQRSFQWTNLNHSKTVKEKCYLGHSRSAPNWPGCKIITGTLFEEKRMEDHISENQRNIHQCESMQTDEGETGFMGLNVHSEILRVRRVERRRTRVEDLLNNE